MTTVTYPPLPGVVARAALRLASVACIRDADTAAGGNVYSNRARAVRPQSERYAVSVFYEQDEGDVLEGSERLPQRLEHRLELGLELHVAGGARTDGSESTDDQTDLLWGQVVGAMESSRDLGLPGIYAGGRYLRTSWDFDANGAEILGACRIAWELRYFRIPCEGSPHFLEPLRTLYARFDLEDPFASYPSAVEALADATGAP